LSVVTACFAIKISVAQYNVKATGHVAKLHRDLSV